MKTAYNYFWNYLEQMDEYGKTAQDTNNFRLLALYTDIRAFDTEIREAGKKLFNFTVSRSGSMPRVADTNLNHFNELAS